MRIARHPDVDKDIKNLRKHRRLQEGIDSLERLLAMDLPPPGTSWSNFPLVRDSQSAVIIKTKVVVPGTNFGKRKGIRYIYERLFHEGEEWCCCFAIYMHSEGTSEQDIRNRIKARHRDFQIDWELEVYECTPPAN